MARIPGIAFLPIAIVIVCVLSGCPRSGGEQESERWFIPGPFGHKTGGSPAPPSERSFLTRALGVVETPGSEEWGTNNHLTKPLAFSHNLGRVFPPKLYDDDPGFFPFVDGRRLRPSEGSYFWNPDLGREDVAAFAADAARAHFAAEPNNESFSIGANDGLVFGESVETMAAIGPPRWFRERPDFSSLVFGFANHVAEDLARTHPRKFLGTLAYYWAENTPPFPVNPQVAPFLTADRSQGYDEGFRREELLLQERWARAGPRRLGLYDYLYGSGFLVPRIHTKLLAENLRHARRAGFTDYFAEVGPNWGLDGPMPWLTAQLLLDPEQSPEVLLDEYYRRYFRGAAVPMRRFFERCERQWMTQAGPAYWLKHYRNESQADVFPSGVCRELRGWLNVAATQAGGGIAGARVQLVSDAFGVTERFVAMHESREALKRHVLEKESGARQLIGALEIFLRRRAEFIGYTERLQTEQPLAIAPFKWDDYLRDDPVSAAVLAARRKAAAENDLSTAEASLFRLNLPEVAGLWRAGDETGCDGGRELLRNGSMAGALQPARRIAGLFYGLAMPTEWLSTNEPTEHFRADWSDTMPRVLRLTGDKDSQIYQWNPADGGHIDVARVEVRGRVSPGTVVSLVVHWLDWEQKRAGELKAYRLPEGDWPDWATLEIAARAPENAAWVGVGLRVQNQMPGDWAEAREFDLRALP